MSKISPNLSNNDIYETLKNEIIFLKLVPGQTIGEIDISKRFNVSRTPIREVFKRLEYDNLITIVPNKGTTINPIRLETVSEVMYLREKLEMGIVEDIVPIMKENTLTALKLKLIRQQKVIDDTSISLVERSLLFYELDNQFHQNIFSLANKENLWHHFIDFGLDYLRFRAVTAELNTEEDLQNLFNDHCKIFQLISNKDVKGLRELYSSHIYKGLDSFVKVLTEKNNYFVV